MLSALFMSLALAAAPQDVAAIEESGLCYVGAQGMRLSVEADMAAGMGMDEDEALVADLRLIENRSVLRLELLNVDGLPEADRAAIDERVKVRLNAMTGEELFGLMDACWNWLGLAV